MKVLVFTTQFHQLGGYERLAVELAIELNRLGIQADILSLYTNKIHGVIEAEQRLREVGIQNVSYLGLSVNPSLMDVIGSILRFRKFVLNRGYTAIEVSGFIPPLLAAIASRSMNVKVVVGIHRNYSPNLHRGIRNFIWRNVLRFADQVTFYGISKSVRNDWLDYTGIARHRVFMIPNSINPTFYEEQNMSICRDKLRKHLGCAKGASIVLFVGRLMKSKGIDTLFNALKKHLIPHDLHLVYVGREDNTETSSDAKLLTSMKSKINAGPWRDRVHFLGLRSDVPEIMVASDVLVHPARREGFGLVLAEALAIGLPIVASDVDGIPEVLTGADSVMLPPDDPTVLRHAVLTVLAWPTDKLNAAVFTGKQLAESFRAEKRAKAILGLLKP